jgi:hypothetical protein
MTPDVVRAIWISIGVGLVIQVIALLVARSFRRDRIMLGWGLGTLLRLVTLVVYALAVVPALGLPLTPALLSLVALFAVTTIIEPFLLSK